VGDYNGENNPMRTALLTTTALAAGGLITVVSAGSALAQQKGLQLGIGGYFQAYYIFADQDKDGLNQPANNRRGDDFKREAEIHFTGRTTLDNGLTVGVHVELEAEVSADQIDESYLFFQGSWGRVILGSENAASYLLSVAGRPVDPSIDGADPNYRLYQPGGNRASLGGGTATAGGSAGFVLAPTLSGDSEKVTYLTPRWNGFMAGLSFTGDNSEDAAVGQVNAKGGTFIGMPLDNRVGLTTNAIEFGVNYEGNIGPVKTVAAVTYGHADIEARTAATPNLAGDYNEFTAGFLLGFAGFDLGFGYYYSDNGLRDNGDKEVFTVTLGYSWGPFRVGFSYTDASFEAGTTTAVNAPLRDDELRRYVFGGHYDYGPGMQLRASVQIYDQDGADNSSTATNDRNDAVVFAIGTVVNF
jgi:outer membrane protein OmpU